MQGTTTLKFLKNWSVRW